MEISAFSSNAVYTSQSVSKINAKTDKTENTQNTTSLLADGDIVEISDEAQNRLKSAQASSAADTAQSDTGGGDTSSSTASSGVALADATGTVKRPASGPPPSGSASSSSSSTDATSKLEQQISALEEEITALAAKALTDDTAKGELAVKQAELSGLTAQLAQVQSQTQA